MQLYKYSQFNIIADQTPARTLIYNTLTKKSTYLDKEDQKLIINQTNIDPLDILHKYIEDGFVVPVDKDEIKCLESTINKRINTKNQMYVIVPTLKCNYRCKYCFELTKLSSKAKMDNDVANATVNYITDNNNGQGVHLRWFGGEPLLSIDTINLITNKLLSNGIKLTSSIISNGRLLTIDNIKILKQCHIKNICVTVDGLDQTNAIEKGCTNKDLEIVLNNVKNARQNGVSVSIKINVSIKNRDEIKELIQKIIDINGKDISITLSRVYNYQHSMDHLQYNDFCSEITEFAAQIGYTKLKIDIPIGMCEAYYKNHIVINHNGDFYRCENCLNIKEMVCGNVSTGIVDNQYEKYWTAPSIATKCLECEYIPICLGGCKYDRLYNIDKCNCEAIKQSIKQRISIS